MNDDKNKTALLHRGPDHSAPYPMSRLAPAFSLVDTAREIEKADQLVTAVVSAELRLISEQIKALQDKAREVIERAQRDAELHRSACRFKKVPGAIYHLYVRDNESRYFSMLSPQDWNGTPPHVFLGSFRLEADLSFSLLG